MFFERISRLISTLALFVAFSCLAQKPTSVVAILPDQVLWKAVKTGQAPGLSGEAELASLAGNP
jgi:hypothetical protein